MVAEAVGVLCRATKANGQPCTQIALPGEPFCIWHSENPDVVARRRAMATRGGAARHGRQIGPVAPPPEPIVITTVEDVLAAVSRELTAVLSLEKSLSRAKTVAQLLTVALKVFEGRAGDVEGRLAELERIVNELRQAISAADGTADRIAGDPAAPDPVAENAGAGDLGG